MVAPIPPWPGECVGLGGGRSVFVRRAAPDDGRGEPAVFVHGLGGSSTNWTDLMDELRDLVDGRAPDLPGFGESPPAPDGDYSVDAHVATVAALIETIGDGPVHLFGNSLGGMVATRLAAERPELVRSLTLVAPALPDLWPRIGPLRMAVAGIPGLGPPLLRRVQRIPAERRVRATFDTVYYDPSRLPEERLREAIEDTLRADERGHEVTALGGSLRALVAEYFRPPGPRALWRQATEVTAPTLLVYGRHDRLVDPRMAHKARRAFRDARLTVLGESGHVPQMEQPAETARAFRSFHASLGAGMRGRAG